MPLLAQLVCNLLPSVELNITPMKKPVSTRLHGFIDYLICSGLLLPYIMNYAPAATDTIILTVLGTAALLVNLLTNYEYSLMHLISMKAHLAFDFVLGLVLIVLPYFFPMVNYYFYWPVALGVSQVLLVLGSSSKPYVVRPKDLNIIQS